MIKSKFLYGEILRTRLFTLVFGIVDIAVYVFSIVGAFTFLTVSLGFG